MEQNTFIVSPMSRSISLKPGETYTGTINIVNPSDAESDITYSASITPYSVIGADYTADLVTVSNYSQILNWITLSNSSGTISPNSSTELSYTITVPKDAPAGGQYATILISQASLSTTDTVSSSVGIASLIYADVAGETTHSGQILENSIPGFSLTTPIAASALVDNTGNVHETATIELSVINSITGEKIFPKSNDGSETSGTFNEIIMPGSTRLIMRQIDDLPALGIINVTQTVQYSGETSTVSQNVILCPIWFIAIVTLTITAIITAIAIRIRHHRHAKK